MASVVLLMTPHPITHQLRAEMERQRINQSEIARRAHYSREAISKALSGGSAYPIETWTIMADVLGFDLTIILTPRRERSTEA